MTDAYIEGFCKTAADAGVEPVTLVKCAARYAGPGVIKRLGQLLAGGDSQVIAPFRNAQKEQTEFWRLLGHMATDGMRDAARGTGEYANTAFKDRITGIMKALGARAATEGIGAYGRHIRLPLQAIRGTVHAHRPGNLMMRARPGSKQQKAMDAAQSEFRKVLAARLGVGGAVAGTGAGIASAVSDND